MRVTTRSSRGSVWACAAETKMLAVSHSPAASQRIALSLHDLSNSSPSLRLAALQLEHFQGKVEAGFPSENATTPKC
jgi:hypothetical protein